VTSTTRFRTVEITVYEGSHRDSEVDAIQGETASDLRLAVGQMPGESEAAVQKTKTHPAATEEKRP